MLDPACPLLGGCRESSERLIQQQSVIIEISKDLLEDFRLNSDLMSRVLSGEIELKPVSEPERHRCLACWLVALLPGHDRCPHGRLSCEECSELGW
jgi:hypothetical protein